MTARQVHVNCASCGAGQDVLGGGRVRVHVCTYCGATLDAADDYGILINALKTNAPKTPFKIGMTGEVFGQPFTVIGIIEWEENHAGYRYTWVDHQIYSPTHGYAWLTLEGSTVTFTRKVRDLPSPAVISSVTIETSENRPKVTFRGQTHSYYASGTAQPRHIAGSFNFVPRVTQRVHYVELVANGQMLSILSQDGEREYELSTLPDQDALAASFGLPAGSLSVMFSHPLKPYVVPTGLKFLRNAAFVGGTASLLMAIFAAGAGDRVASQPWTAASAPLEVPFTVTSPRGLTEIRLGASVDNSWAGIETELLDAEGETVAEYEAEVAYYHGRDADGSWTEGTKTVSTKLELPPGDYTLVASLAETVVDWPGGRPANRLSVTVWQGVWHGLWLYLNAGLWLGIGLIFLLVRWARASMRLSGGDWSDE